MGFFKLKSFKLKNLKILVCIVFFLFLLGIVWHFFGSYKKEGFRTGEIGFYDKDSGLGLIDDDDLMDDYHDNRNKTVEMWVDDDDASKFYEGAKVSYNLDGDRAINIKLISPPATTRQAQAPVVAPAPAPAPAPAAPAAAASTKINSSQ